LATPGIVPPTRDSDPGFDAVLLIPEIVGLVPVPQLVVAVSVGVDKILTELKVKGYFPLKRGVGVVMLRDPAASSPKPSPSPHVSGERVEVVVGCDAWNCCKPSANVAAAICGVTPGLRIVDDNVA